jgi:hypothetical protein
MLSRDMGRWENRRALDSGLCMHDLATLRHGVDHAKGTTTTNGLHVPDLAGTHGGSYEG